MTSTHRPFPAAQAGKTPSLQDSALTRLQDNGADQVLAQFLERSTRRAAEISPGFAQLWTEIERLSTGGKRFRPALVALAANAYGDPEQSSVTDRMIATVGAAFELLHSALIIHDDVIDRDTSRRHGPTLHTAAQQRAEAQGIDHKRAAHYGHSVGIIAGDLALSGAHHLVHTAGLPPEHTWRVLELVDHAVFASAAGELMDIDHALPAANPTPAAVVEATRLKTSVYSFEAPLQAGAVLAGAPQEHIQVLGEIGVKLGLAFQLADDLLGVFGRDRDTGKSTDGDLREGKHTLLIAEAGARDGGAEVLTLLAQPELTARDADRVRQVLTDCGARQAVEEQAAEAAREAVALAESAGLPPALVRQLRDVARDAVERIR